MDVMRSAAARVTDSGHLNAHPAPAHPKILLYSHDTFGLGNIRRTLLLADYLGATYPRSAILVLTGSPMIHAFRIPPRVDYVKLPCVNRIRADEYEPRFLADCGEEVRCTRSAIIERTATAFAPDLFIVDKRAGGIDNELVPALEAMRRLATPPRVVLGLRDILDAPDVTGRSLRANGSFDLIERFYDEVWIYGSRDVFDAVAEYNFPPAVAARSHFCGYLRRHAAPRTAHGGSPRILVTAGGGGDAAVLVLSYLRGLAQVPEGEFQTVVVLGPQLDPETADGLRRLGAQRLCVALDHRVGVEPDFLAEQRGVDARVLERAGPIAGGRHRGHELNGARRIQWKERGRLAPPAHDGRAVAARLGVRRDQERSGQGQRDSQGRR